MKHIRKVFLIVIKVLICLVLGTMIFAVIRGQMLITQRYEVICHFSERRDFLTGDEKSEATHQVLDYEARIVAISDLHGNKIGSAQSRLIKQVQRENPDIIIYLGDMVDRTNLSDSIASLIMLTERLVDIAPVYYVDGNHEVEVRENNPEKYELLNNKMISLGAVHLDNEIVQVEVGNQNSLKEPYVETDDYRIRKCTVNICGISTHYRWGDKEHSLCDELREMDGINVLACHYPESVLWYDAFAGGGVDVALCGHTHGGLIKVPFKGGLYAPEQARWPLYCQGSYLIYTDTTIHSYGGADGAECLGSMIISAGLAGEHGIPRINNPMEVSLVEVR